VCGSELGEEGEVKNTFQGGELWGEHLYWLGRVGCNSAEGSTGGGGRENAVGGVDTRSPWRDGVRGEATDEKERQEVGTLGG